MILVYYYVFAKHDWSTKYCSLISMESPLVSPPTLPRPRELSINSFTYGWLARPCKLNKFEWRAWGVLNIWDGFMPVQLKNGCMSSAGNTVTAPRLRWSCLSVESIESWSNVQNEHVRCDIINIADRWWLVLLAPRHYNNKCFSLKNAVSCQITWFWPLFDEGTRPHI
jgi:hypothetical protein